MSQTLLTNKKQGNLDEVHAANIILSQRKLALTARNTHFALQNHWSTQKNKKNGPVPSLGLELTIRHQKPNPSRETVPVRI